MRKIEWVSISSILVDTKLPLNTQTLGVVDHLRAGNEMKPIHLQPCGPNNKGKFRLRDGRHRFVAAKMLGWSRIPATYSTKLNRKLN